MDVQTSNLVRISFVGDEIRDCTVVQVHLVTYAENTGKNLIKCCRLHQLAPLRFSGIFFSTRAAWRREGGIVFSSVCLFVCLFVWVSINTITPKSLEISRTFQGIILWLKERPSCCRTRLMDSGD